MSDKIGQKHRMNPNSLANLKPAWQPGQSGNPGGNYKNTPKISNAYNRLLALTLDELRAFKAANVAEEIALKLVRAAVKDSTSLQAVKEITDRTEGKAKQNMVIEEKPANESAMDEAFRIFCDLSANLGLSEDELRAEFDAMKATQDRKVM